MVAEVFLLGHWKDYDELEETLSMPELLLTLEAQRKVKWREYKFHAALQGVSLPDDDEEVDGKKQRTFEDIKRDAMIRASGGDPSIDDVTNLVGSVAQQEGFGLGIEGGLNYNNY
jgi:hypothetical protein